LTSVADCSEPGSCDECATLMASNDAEPMSSISPRETSIMCPDNLTPCVFSNKGTCCNTDITTCKQMSCTIGGIPFCELKMCPADRPKECKSSDGKVRVCCADSETCTTYFGAAACKQDCSKVGGTACGPRCCKDNETCKNVNPAIFPKVLVCSAN